MQLELAGRQGLKAFKFSNLLQVVFLACALVSGLPRDVLSGTSEVLSIVNGSHNFTGILGKTDFSVQGDGREEGERL